MYPATDSVMRSVETTTVIGKYSFPAGSDFMVKCKIKDKLVGIIVYFLCS